MYKTTAHKLTTAAASIVFASLIAASCGASDSSSTPADSPVVTEAPVSTDGPTETPGTVGQDDAVIVVSASEGLQARASVAERGAAASDSLAAESSLLVDGTCGVYQPSPEDIAESNATSEALAAAFDRFGISYDRATDDFGFLSIDYDSNDVIVQAVSESFWTSQFPSELDIETIPQEQIDEIIATNDVIVTELDAAGVAYTRTTDDQGWENLEYDYDDPVAQEAVNAAWNIISPPQPPEPEVLAQMQTDNAAVAAALNSAGVEYQRYADDLGWEWIEWDYQDQAANDAVDAAYSELYPPIEIAPFDDCADVAMSAAGDLAVTSGVAESNEAVESVTEGAPAPEEVDADKPVDDLEPIFAEPEPPFEDFAEPTDEELAQRDAEVTAMIDGFTAAGVTFETYGESPWRGVVFDIDNEASVSVIRGILDARA